MVQPRSLSAREMLQNIFNLSTSIDDCIGMLTLDGVDHEKVYETISKRTMELRSEVRRIEALIGIDTIDYKNLLFNGKWTVNTTD